jgi:hypothetical protein
VTPNETTLRLSPQEIARFWSKVVRTEACWPWIAATSNKGYGVIRIRKRNFYAHRVAYTVAYGDLPADKTFVCHGCDQRACTRPDHLFAGDASDNMRDMVSKARHAAITQPDRVARGDRNGRRLHPGNYPDMRGDNHPLRRHPDLITWRGDNHWLRQRPGDALRGEAHGRTTLTENDVREIRRLAAAGTRQQVLADHFGVRQTTISNIVHRVTWGHVA